MNSVVRWAVVITGLITLETGLLGFGQKTLFGIRSQATNGVRQLAGWQRHIYRANAESDYLSMAITPEYDHSFRHNEITQFLFGCDQLTFSGSLVSDREATDILADYLGLPSDFKSIVHFRPTITNFIVDFDWYIGLDGTCPGLYARLHLPVVCAKWDIRLHECIADPGTTFTSYPAGYLSSTPIELTTLTVGPTAPKDVTTALEGKAVFGDMREPLQYGKVFGREYETRVADLSLEVGYNFLLSTWYHMGISVCGAAPTGTLRKSYFLFDPIAGNDHHWELGGNLTGHVDVWSNEDTGRQVGFYVTAHVTHLFGSKQRRSFDLCKNGPGSRYMLLEKMAAPTVGLNIGIFPNNVTAPIQYMGRLVPAINKTTLDATVRIGAQADIVAKLYYQHRGFEADFGYNFWGRSRETLANRGCLESGYAVKGDAQIYGFVRPVFDPDETPVALSATQNRATIRGGQDMSDDATAIGKGNFVDGLQYTNSNCDNPVMASDTSGMALDNLTTADATRLGFTQQFIQTSSPAILVTDNDINEDSALLPKAISNKIFTFIGYSLEREVGVIPSIGVGGFVEWAHTSVCDNSALSQWGLWLRGGLSF